MKPVIELRDATKVYQMGENRLQVLKHIDLKINRGEDVVIIGASGSGKSTLLNIIGCLDKPTAGKVFVEGKDTSKMSDSELAIIRGTKIGFVFQFFYLLPNMTALENVEMPMMFAGRKIDKDKAKNLLKKVGLEKRMDHYPNQLSGGEQQRVAIARALANDPDILLADEPTGNLDSKTGQEIINILQKMNKERKNMTLVIITHDLSIAKILKRKVYLRDGVIIKRD